MEIIPTQKIINRDGIKAVKNGQKANQACIGSKSEET